MKDDERMDVPQMIARAQYWHGWCIDHEIENGELERLRLLLNSVVGYLQDERDAVFEQAHTPSECLDCGRTDGGCDRVATGLKPHTAYTVRVNGSEPVTLTTQGEPTDEEREASRRAWGDFQLTEDFNLIPMHCAGYAMAAFHAGFAAGFRRTVQGEPRHCLTEHPITGWRCSRPAEPGHGHVCDLPPATQGEPSEHFHIWSDLPCKAGECRMEPQSATTQTGENR